MSTYTGGAATMLPTKLLKAAGGNQGNHTLMQAKHDLVTVLLQIPINEDSLKSVIKRILNMNYAWTTKYPNPTFTQLITNNSTETGWLDRLIACMSILEKYGRNLLKPDSTRPSGWHNINFNIYVFKTKVDIIMGARRVLQELGYTVPTRMGITYPPNTEPVPQRVAPTLGDIIMIHHELLGYYYNTHPYPSIIDALLPPQMRKHGNQFTPPNYVLPHPSWTSPSSPPEEEDHNSCTICGGAPMWLCPFCKLNLCDGCDHSWHRHPARNQHHRTPLTPNPGQIPPLVTNGRAGISPTSSPTGGGGQPYRPSPVNSPGQHQQPAWSAPVGAPELPTVLESAHTFNSQEGEQLRSQIQAMKDDKDQLPSGVPKLSIFLGDNDSAGSPSPQGAEMSLPPSRSPGSWGVSPEALNERLEAEIEKLTMDINELIATVSDFYKDPVYKALCLKRSQTRNQLSVIQEDHSKVSPTGPVSSPWKAQITTPPATVYVPPMLRVPPKVDIDEEVAKGLRMVAPSEAPHSHACPACGCMLARHVMVCPACGHGSTKYPDASVVSLPDESKWRWKCNRCTFVNEPSAKKECSMCFNVSKNPTYIDVDDNEVDLAQAAARSPQLRRDSVAARLQEEEENHLSEKQLANEKFGKREMGRQQTDQLSRSRTIPSRTRPEQWSNTTPRRSQSVTAKGSSPIDIDSLRMTWSVGSRLSSLSGMPPLTSPEEKRRQDMFTEGKALVEKIKASEKEKFGPEEFELAYNQVEEDGDVVQWLRTVWTPTVESVILQVAQINTPPIEASRTEAKQALLAASFDLPTAVQNCVHLRLEKVDEVLRTGPHDEEIVHHLLGVTEGSVDDTLEKLNTRTMEPFMQRAWDEVDKDTISDPTFTGSLLDDSVDKDRRLRMLLVEGKLRSWGRADNVLRLLRRSRGEGQAEGEDWSGVHLPDIVEIVKGVDDYRTAVTLLQQKCLVCFGLLPETKMQSLVCCECKVCRPCLFQYFEIQVRGQHVRNWVCPVCSQPDIEDEEKRDAHFQFMELLLKDEVKQDLYELFEKKLRDWSLMKDPNFRWCSHCDFGFLFNSEEMLKMTCPKCKRHTCFQCKKPWEVQHEEITCEQFQAWKEANDPELQSQGLAKILAENGIDCPGCKFRYSLAKGGCMHFKCTQCQHEFCSGCHKPFKRGETCGKFDTCKQEGLHCHHPRDCLFYLRDYDIDKLQQLLTDHTINFNTENQCGDKKKGTNTCPVLEQKEQVDGLIDEACGQQVPDEHAGLCEVHYKEYLVNLINKHHIDPMEIMTEAELTRVLDRSKTPIPPKRKKESAQEYRTKLVREIQEKLPLPPAPKPVPLPAMMMAAPAQRPVQEERRPTQEERKPAQNLPEEGVRRIPEENAEEAVHWI